MSRIVLSTVLATSLVLVTGPAGAVTNPEILLSPRSLVPACVTPERLITFVKWRNKKLRKSFKDIAYYYQKHGEEIGVRWDYAFYQMIIETNWLRFHAPNGRKGDVSPSQNNFAGLGATGGGVPGEHFADVSTGVLAHLQHIKMYSGQIIENPVADRTRSVQDWLVPKLLADYSGNRTFTHLTKRWSPGDSGYAKDIAYVAERYLAKHCPEGTDAKHQRQIMAEADSSGTQVAKTADTETTYRTRKKNTKVASADRQAGLPAPATCRVWTAAYDNAEKAVLIRSASASTVNYTALAVTSDLLGPQAEAFIAQHAKGGKTIGEFSNSGAALNRAFELCPQS